MGNLLSCKKAETASKDAVQAPQADYAKDAPPAAQSSALAKSLAFFDAAMTEKDFENMPEIERNELAESVFMSSRELASITSTTASCEIPYRPATVADRHPRQSMSFDKPETLIKRQRQARRSVMESVFLRKELQKPTTAPALGLAGYPGDLSKHELEQVLDFRRMLKAPERKVYHDMVRIYKTVEEEPYALCRFLRSRQFEPQTVLDMLSEQTDKFQQAQSKDFYKDIQATLGCPLSTFNTQFPFIYHNTAKNGSVVAYFFAGKLSLDGMDCCLGQSLEHVLVKYMWFSLRHALQHQVKKALDDGVQGVRCELTVVIDLKGMSSSILGSRTMDAFKSLTAATGSFPEILNHVVIVNAPSFFSFSWKIIRNFLDPRTRAKIEIFGNGGQKRLMELMESKNLLQELGGQGPSFGQVIQQQQDVQPAATTETTTQMTELLCLAKGKTGTMNVKLSASQQAEVMVYSKVEGASVKVLQGDKVVAETKSNSSNAQVATGIKGAPLTVQVKNDKSSDKAYFLVVVQVKVVQVKG